MTLHWDNNNAVMTGAAALFKFKALLVVCGWVVRSSGDGLSAFSSSGDIITTGASGAGGLANTGAWFVIEMPTANSVNRQLLVQRGASNTSWLTRYSYSAKFTGGSPSATVIPTATDQQNINCSGSTAHALMPTDSTYRWNMVASDAAPYGLVASAFPSGGGAADHAFCMLPLTVIDVGDIDPYAFYLSASASSFTAADMLANMSCWYRKGLTDQFWADPLVSTATSACAYRRSANPTTNSVPANLGPNPHTGNDDVYDIPIGRAVNGTGRYPMGYKGMSQTLLLWNGNARTTADTLDISSSKDRLALANCNMPWDGSTVTI